MHHDAYVVPYESVIDKWMLRCTCGLMAEYSRRQEADEACDEHLVAAEAEAALPE